MHFKVQDNQQNKNRQAMHEMNHSLRDKKHLPATKPLLNLSAGLHAAFS